MSAKNRGKGAKGRVKRREVQSEDGWTVITHGMSKVSLDNKTSKKDQNRSVVSDGLPTQTVAGLTAEKLLADFKSLQDRWASTALARQIEQLVGNRKWDIDAAVCIGIGSFSLDWQHRHRSMWQLVSFIAVIRHLNNPEVRIYAQDPAFTPLDTAFLALLNISTTTSGLEEHISTTSFLFSPFVDWFILLPMFVRDRDPALYVGNEILDDYAAVAQSEEKKAKAGECAVWGQGFLDGRRNVKLREFEAGHGLEGMWIYHKPTTQDQPPPPT